MKLATTIGDFKGYTASWEEAVRLFRDTGFRYLDFDFYSVNYPGSPFIGDNWMDAIQVAAEAAKELGFSFVQAHSPNYNPLNPNADHETGMLATLRSIEACGYLGIDTLVMHAGKSVDGLCDPGKAYFFENNRKFYQSLFPAMEKYNVNVLIENGPTAHAMGSYIFTRAEAMVEFLEYCDHPLLHACWDTGHANMDALDQYQQICTLDKHLKAVHFQDNFGISDEHFAPFMGTLDIDAIIQALIAVDFQGPLTFESNNIIMPEGMWPHARQASPSITHRPLQRPSIELRRKAEAFLYEIGKYILTAYDLYEY